MILIVLSIMLMILIITEFTKGILAQVKMFYKENEQMSKSVFIRLKFWGEIWYMSTLLVITFDKKIALMQNLQNWKLDFKSFPTVYYMHNSDYRARNDNRLKFVEIVSRKADSTAWSLLLSFLLSFFFPLDLITLFH